MTSPSGVIVSPGHPNTYPHGANCTWFISVDPGNLIRLSFDSFNLEYHSNCNYDYVELYDNGTVETGTKLDATELLKNKAHRTGPALAIDKGGQCPPRRTVCPPNRPLPPGGNAYQIGQQQTGLSAVQAFCGRSVPPSVTSTDSLLTLLFVSDTSLSVEGFSARYVSINASTDCSESFTSSTGSFFSPNYPNYYPNGRDCFFTITVQVNLQIMLNFTDFELEVPRRPATLTL
ncbi:hypothetical protein WMY93_029777 [Mugilogobius chulae]|uniref:CUB domain-containing protein n=1 Tax=Mugilogobius chulae TaxID=88201 RepID=A0AAW0MXX3_9GOBI